MDNREERTDARPPAGADDTDADNLSRAEPQDDSSGPSRLGFREFVPGAEYDSGDSDEKNNAVGIPEFDLNQQMMAAQRREAAAKRRGPDRSVPSTETEAPRQSRSMPEEHGWATENAAILLERSAPKRNPLIAEIVRRDIERLCKPQP